jgi:hypothetical protein
MGALDAGTLGRFGGFGRLGRAGRLTHRPFLVTDVQ